MIVGLTDPELIQSHKRLSAYGKADFQLLDTIVEKSSRLVATSHILTETSNLLGKPANPNTKPLLVMFASLLAVIERLEEIAVPSASVVDRSEFWYLGLTDTAALVEHESDFTLLTADNLLYVASLCAGRKAVYFPLLKDNH